MEKIELEVDSEVLDKVMLNRLKDTFEYGLTEVSESMKGRHIHPDDLIMYAKLSLCLIPVIRYYSIYAEGKRYVKDTLNSYNLSKKTLRTILQESHHELA